MRLRTRAITSVMSVVAVVLAVLAVPGSATAREPAGLQVLTGTQKQATELAVLTKFVPFAESFWRASDISEPDTGRYLATGPGVTQPRGAGDIAFVYATLLTAEPDTQSFGGVARETLLDHTIRSIRYEALTNKLSGAGYDRWGGDTWQASLETYQWAYAAHLLWSHLDADTQALVRRVLVGEANILITKPIATATPGNTGAEDNGWNTPTPALAAVMFPDDPNREAWEQTAIKLALNASSTAADADSATVVDGKPLRDWMASVNLHDDLTMENHGFFNPIYQQVTHTNINDAAIFYAQAGDSLPQAFSFRTEQIWNQILGRLVDDNGDIIMPAGQDWISKDFQHLDYLSVLATRFGRADASVLESRALRTVAQRQATHADGSILGQPDLGYESMLAKRIAASWWNHHLFGPSPTPTAAQFAQARAATAGVHRFPSVDVIVGRLQGATATMSWDSERPMGLWVPRERDHLDDPIFTYYAPGSLIGSASGRVSGYSCACGTDRFSTAGVIGARDFSMTTFPDGTAVLLDRGTGATFTYSLERIAGVTGPRPVYSAGGQGIGALSGNWVDVADRMAMVVLGGSGISVADTTGTNDTRKITGSTGTGSGNRGAVLYPDLGHSRAAALAALAAQPAVPDGWSALTARAADGTDRLAIARWSGTPSATLRISDPRGAPVPRESASLSGDRASFTARLDAPASEGELLRFFVDADGTLQAHQDGENRAVLVNPGARPVTARVTYVGPDGAHNARRVIQPGETVTARLIGSSLSLAGPEYEPLLNSRATMEQLLNEISVWQRSGQLDRGSAARLSAATRSVLRDTSTALSAAAADDPDTNSTAAAVGRAVRRLGRLARVAGLPADVADAVDGVREATRNALDQAAAALTVTLLIEPLGTAMPGEPIALRVTMLNRGHGSATHGTLRVSAPEGWSLPPGLSAFDALPPGHSAALTLRGTLGAGVRPGTTGRVKLRLNYDNAGQQHGSAGAAGVPVRALFTIQPRYPAAPLASGGQNRAEFSLHNNAATPISVTLAADAPDNITAMPSPAQLDVPAGGDGTVTVALTDHGVSTGTGTLVLHATSGAGVSASAQATLEFSDNLALNPTTAPWPKAFADSHQPSYPPALVNDGDAGTFWVSGGVNPGDGPTPQHPIAVGVDLGAVEQVGSVTVVPRVSYGPKSYQVQLSTDGTDWTAVATVVNGPNATRTASFAPASARYVRLLITDGYDRYRPPRNVQVAELQVHAG